LLRERVYWVVVRKRLWYIRLSRSRCIATSVHLTLLLS
jgi:hypothetical protein